MELKILRISKETHEELIRTKVDSSAKKGKRALISIDGDKVILDKT